jgi:hypothetical protein
LRLGLKNLRYWKSVDLLQDILYKDRLMRHEIIDLHVIFFMILLSAPNAKSHVNQNGYVHTGNVKTSE